MQWWLWKVDKVAPKVTKTFDLSWPYVRDIHRRTMERAELEHDELQKHAETEESGGFITAALDAFQEKGTGDSRFLKRHHSTRRKSAAQLDREIATALSRSPGRRPPMRRSQGRVHR